MHTDRYFPWFGRLLIYDACPPPFFRRRARLILNLS